MAETIRASAAYRGQEAMEAPMIRRSFFILALTLAGLWAGACTEPSGGAGAPGSAAPAEPTPAASSRSDYSY